MQTQRGHSEQARAFHAFFEERLGRRLALPEINIVEEGSGELEPGTDGCHVRGTRRIILAAGAGAETLCHEMLHLYRESVYGPETFPFNTESTAGKYAVVRLDEFIGHLTGVILPIHYPGIPVEWNGYTARRYSLEAVQQLSAKYSHGLRAALSALSAEDSQLSITCQALERILAHPIAQLSGYTHVRSASLRDALQLAQAEAAGRELLVKMIQRKAGHLDPYHPDRAETVAKVAIRSYRRSLASGWPAILERPTSALFQERLAPVERAVRRLCGERGGAAAAPDPTYTGRSAPSPRDR